MVKNILWKATLLVAVCFLGSGIVLGHRCQRTHDFDHGLRLTPSWSHHFPRSNSLIHPFRDSFGFNSIFDDEFFQDPWFQHDLFCPWGRERGCSLHDDIDRNEEGDDMSKWVQNRKEQWEQDYQQRKQAWEEDEQRAKENYFGRLDHTKAVHDSQKEESADKREDHSNDVSIEIIGSVSNDKPDELLTMRILGYNKDDISVITEGRKIHIQGKHSSGDCKQGTCISKEFKKTFVLPKEVQVSSVKAKFDDNGILRIEKNNNNDKGILEQNDNVHHHNQDIPGKANMDMESTRHFVHDNSIKQKDVDVNHVGDKYHDDDVTIEVTE